MPRPAVRAQAEPALNAPALGMDDACELLTAPVKLGNGAYAGVVVG